MPSANAPDRGTPDHSRFTDGFEQTFALADRVPGWLTRAQAETLYDRCHRLEFGAHAVEVGSHLGRSTVVLGLAAPAGVQVTAIDPLRPDWRYGLSDTESQLRENLRISGVTGLDLRVSTSDEVRLGWTAPVDLVFIDGKHDYWSTRNDLRWAEHLSPGGLLLLHDCFSSLGVTSAVLAHVLPAGHLRYSGRVGSLAILERGRPTITDRARLLAQLPWWIRNLAVKVLLRLRLRPAARLLGHRDTADPY